MYWKLLDSIEYDFGEMPMKTSKIIGVVMAVNPQDAAFWFKLLAKNNIIHIPPMIYSNLIANIEPATLEEYQDFRNML
ncbi:MAG: hypothetical protein II625_08015 [Bacilli bacterium]|nr:hypothetical protein [Bacilli bacterium]